MSLIPSATTLTLTGHLTESGRKYLFAKDANNNPYRIDDEGLDTFKPVKFSLYDSDVNYYSTSNLDSGDLTALSGEKDNECLNTVNDGRRKNVLIYGDASFPGISFEFSKITINEGDNVNINILLAYYIFTLNLKSALVSVNNEETTLPPEDYRTSKLFSYRETFEDGINDKSIFFESLTSQKYFVNETRKLVLELSNFIDSSPGEFVKIEICIQGTKPLPVESNFTSAANINTPTNGSIITVAGDNIGSLGVSKEFYISLDSADSFITENFKLSLNGTNEISFNTSFIVIEMLNTDGTRPSNYSEKYDPTSFRNAITGGEDISVDLSDFNGKKYALIRFTTFVSFSQGTTQELVFTMTDPSEDTTIGTFDEYTLSMFTPAECGDPCETPSLEKTFDNESKWSQIVDNPLALSFQTEQAPYILQEPLSTSWTIYDNNESFAEILFSYRNAVGGAQDVTEWYKQAIFEGEDSNVNYNQLGYSTPIIFQDIDSNISGKHKLSFSLQSYPYVGGAVGAVDQDRVPATRVFFVVRKNNQWRVIKSEITYPENRWIGTIDFLNQYSDPIEFEYTFDGEDAIGIYALGRETEYPTPGSGGGTQQCFWVHGGNGTISYEPVQSYLWSMQCVTDSSTIDGDMALRWRGFDLTCLEEPLECEYVIQRTLVETPENTKKYYSTTLYLNGYENDNSLIFNAITSEDLTGMQTIASDPTSWEPGQGSFNFGSAISPDKFFYTEWNSIANVNIGGTSPQVRTVPFYSNTNPTYFAKIESVELTGPIDDSSFGTGSEINWPIYTFNGYQSSSLGAFTETSEKELLDDVTAETGEVFNKYFVNYDLLNEHNFVEPITTTETLTVSQEEWENDYSQRNEGWQIVG